MNEDDKNALAQLWKREMAGYIAARLRREAARCFSDKLSAEAIAKAERLERGDYRVYDEPFGEREKTTP